MYDKSKFCSKRNAIMCSIVLGGWTAGCEITAADV